MLKKGFNDTLLIFLYVEPREKQPCESQNLVAIFKRFFQQQFQLTTFRFRAVEHSE